MALLLLRWGVFVSNITKKSKKDQTIITNKLTDGEQINSHMLKAIAGGCIEGLIPVSEYSGFGGTRLECCVNGKALLTEKYRGIVPKKVFLSAVLDIIGIIKRCENYDSKAYDNFYLTADSVFIDDAKKISLVYWPLLSNSNICPVTGFLGELPVLFTLDPNEDKGYIDRYMSFFSGREPFDIDRFEAAVKAESAGGNEAQQTTLLQQDSSTSTGLLRFGGSADVENSGTSVLLEDGAGYRQRDFSEYDTATVVLSNESGAMSHRYLVRLKSGERIGITSESFLIGKDMRYCNYTVTDNSAVSRKHAKIIREDDCDYVVDLNSTNKTYVNGQQIPVERQVQIFSGARLRFANEEFIFYAED